MNAVARELTIQKLGTLMLANSEIAAEVRILQAELQKRDQRIAELEAELASMQEKANALKLRLAPGRDGMERQTENLPANPCGIPNAKPH